VNSFIAPSSIIIADINPQIFGPGTHAASGSLGVKWLERGVNHPLPLAPRWKRIELHVHL